MKNIRVECGNCTATLSMPMPQPSFETNCPSCGKDIIIEAFPALLKGPVAGLPGEAVVIDTESSCFYHPQKKAVIPCESCGRFLCALCDIEFNGKHLCPTCLETGAKKGKMAEMRHSTTRYDEIALGLAVYPLIIFYLTLISAPISLYYSIRYWNARVSDAPRGKARFVVAIIFAGLELTGWGIGAFFLVSYLIK